MGLAKATLCEISADKGKQPTESNKLDVQFNPTSLRIQMQNNTDRPKAQERQVQQFNGQGSTTLSLELVFDTADDGGTVYDKTATVRRFMTPKQGSQVPPRVRFHWGSLIMDGVMESYSEELDLFSSEGEPLRAKVGISIKGQDPSFEKGNSGAGARTGDGATVPGSGSPPPTSANKSTAQAIGGESAADFAVRNGLDPSAWRGLTPSGAAAAALPAGLPSTSLPAGLALDFSASLAASAGLGAAGSVSAATSLEAALGGGAVGPPPPGSQALGVAAGGPGSQQALATAQALTAAGGIGSAIDAVAKNVASAASAAAAAAFRTPTSSLGGGAGAGGAGAGAAGAAAAGGRTSAVPTSSAASAAAAALQAATPGVGGGAAGAGAVAAAAVRAAQAGGAAGASLGTTATAARVESVKTPLRLGAPSPPSPAPIQDPRATSYGLGVPLRPRLGGALDERFSAARGDVVIGAKAAVASAGAAPWTRLPPAPPGEGDACGCGREPRGGAR